MSRPLVVRSERTFLHVFVPDRWGFVLGDRLFGVRLGMTWRGRKVFAWRYQR